MIHTVNLFNSLNKIMIWVVEIRLLISKTPSNKTVINFSYTMTLAYTICIYLYKSINEYTIVHPITML